MPIISHPRNCHATHSSAISSAIVSDTNVRRFVTPAHFTADTITATGAAKISASSTWTMMRIQVMERLSMI